MTKRYLPGTKVVAAVSMVEWQPGGAPKGTPGKVVSYTPPIGASPALIYVLFEGTSAPTCCYESDIAKGGKA